MRRKLAQIFMQVENELLDILGLLDAIKRIVRLCLDARRTLCSVLYMCGHRDLIGLQSSFTIQDKN